MNQDYQEGSQNSLPYESAPSWSQFAPESPENERETEKTETVMPDASSLARRVSIDEKPAVPLKAGRQDQIFAVLYFLIGYGLIYTFTSFPMFTKYLALYTVFYAGMTLAYLYASGKKPTKESWFWLAVLLMIGVPFSMWNIHFLGMLQVLALIFTAAYWTLSASGRLLERTTSQWFFFDWWNSIAVVPFTNFSCQFRILKGEGSSAENNKNRENSVLAILLGVVVAVPLLLIILPLLSRADAVFEALAGRLFHFESDRLVLDVIRVGLSIPISCYLYGLIFGGISGRNTDRIDQKRLLCTGKRIRILPDTTVVTALGIICLVYLVFIGIQGNYLFSAFFGEMPEGFTYAEYARRGFFELCRIGVWNLIILFCASLFTRTERDQNKSLKAASVILSAFTLLMIAAAASKMGMYIYVYGLTEKRVVTMVFMIWMTIVFSSIIVQQKKRIPLVKICVITGAILFCMLCVFPVEDWILAYNIWTLHG